MSPEVHPDIEQILIPEHEIQAKIVELAKQITEDYRDHPPVLLGVLKGVACFMTDLMRAINLPVEVEYLRNGGILQTVLRQLLKEDG